MKESARCQGGVANETQCHSRFTLRILAHFPVAKRAIPAGNRHSPLNTPAGPEPVEWQLNFPPGIAIAGGAGDFFIYNDAIAYDATSHP